jgi:hypothetical protein
MILLPKNTCANRPSRRRWWLGSLAPGGTRAAELAPVLETGAWSGATLEQGQWYGMKIWMPMGFLPLIFVYHDVQFAFTRELPCGKNSDRTCVEIVLRAIPDERDLKRTLRDLNRELNLPHGNGLHISSTTYMRLITDPTTLHAYQRDMRQQFALTHDRQGTPPQRRALIGACAVPPESPPSPAARTVHER